MHTYLTLVAVIFFSALCKARPTIALTLEDMANIDATLAALVSPDSATEPASQFEVYALRFEKTYESKEAQNSALSAFVAACFRIRKANAEGHGAAFGLNVFSDIQPLDFNSQYLTYKPPRTVKTGEKLLRQQTAVAPAGAVDWREHTGVVSKVKNQNQCGSCWAFSAVETLESAFVMGGGAPRELSVEQLVACDNGDAGCDGGDSPNAYAYIKAAGGVLASTDYPNRSPQTGQTPQCKIGHSITVNGMSQSLVQLDDFGYACEPCMTVDCASQRNREAALASAVLSGGPASICVSADWGWQDYNGGVLKSASCKSGYQDLDHCVQLVGFDADADEPYWIVRNSWTVGWGEEGYIRLGMGINMCGLANEAMQVRASEGNMSLPIIDPNAPVSPPSPSPSPSGEYEYEYTSPCRTWLWDPKHGESFLGSFCHKWDIAVNAILLLATVGCILSCTVRMCYCIPACVRCCSSKKDAEHDGALPAYDELAPAPVPVRMQ